MKLTQVVRYRGLRVGDELWWDNGSHRQGARVTYIAQGGLIYLDVLDHLGRPGQPFDQADGTPFFTDPESIIGALATHGRRTLPLPPYAGTGLTPWNALEVLRGGRRVGTLNEVREDLRVRGSQQAAPRGSRRRRGGGGGGRRTAVAAPAPAPAPTTAAGDTTGAEGAEEDEMEVDEEDEDGGAD
ncbi:hypothetical protein GJ744_008176 [Endocarpon pusillum]|uniref:Uncharacterized protein n=1 Tax=Endocarpon pusillum TaxID=364733 RepID=A0A8H7AJU9_9EURO|nr:hypothetical protein GJ744_008176 [Endocarpon pusillum]